MKIIFLNVLLIFSILYLQNCKVEPLCEDPSNSSCPNFDPCYGKKPVTADFEIGMTGNPNAIDPFSNMFEEDTIFPNTAIRFRALLKGAKYTWHIGKETIHDSAFTRTFYTTPHGKYKVTLIIEKKTNLDCFPGDDGKDTLSKYFHIVDRCKLQTTGSYKGVWDNQKDSFIFKILYMARQNPTNRWDTCNNSEYVLINGRNYNIKEDTLEYGGVESSVLGNYFGKFIRDDSDYKIYGEFNINPISRKLKFEYTYNYGNHHKIFNGRKL